ncbi:MAG: NHL repeat-containing protein [Phycisphaerae bacterium]|nr:NHL repeat-containing protein [Phycisphaerae bacterium]
MTEALKCPDCSAPLTIPPPGIKTVRCPYCNSTVVISGESGEGIEQLLTDRAILVGTISEATAGATGVAVNGLAFGCGLAMFIMIVVGLIVAMSLRTVHTRTAALKSVPTMPPLHKPVFPTIVVPTFPVTPPAPSAFANQVLEFGAEGIGIGRFKDARSVAIDGAGHVYVGEYTDGRVQVFDAGGHFLKMWTVGKNTPLMNLAANHDGTVLAVTDGRILCYEGNTGRNFGEAAITNGDVQEVYQDACFSPTGDIYAIDMESNIIILNGDGQIKSTISARQKVGDDIALDKIAVNGLGQIYAIDRKKGVFHFAADGRYLNRFGGRDSDDPSEPKTPDMLTFPHNLAIDGQGRVFVADNVPAVRVFNGSGHFLGSFGGNEVAFGLAIDEHGAVYASMRNRYVVRKFQLSVNGS